MRLFTGLSSIDMFVAQLGPKVAMNVGTDTSERVVFQIVGASGSESRPRLVS